MRILVDLGHPAHIHYFKNFIRIMSDKGHHFAFVARDKEVLQDLLDHYGFEYTSRGKGKKSIVGKLFYILYADYILFKVAKRFKPDIFLSFASTYAAHTSWLLRKPHIALDDTEHAVFEIMMYAPFTKIILNPRSYWKHFSPKQVFFDSFMELAYLHPNYFEPDSSVLQKYGIKPNEDYFVVRFVSWTASHDIGHKGIPNDIKNSIIRLLEKTGRVIISSEGALPPEFEKYKLYINPADLHHLLAFAKLYLGEGATTASESVILGTPAIYVNTLDAGTISEQEKEFGLKSLRSAEKIIDSVMSVLNSSAKPQALKAKEKIIKDKIDITAFLVWFVENYPNSKTIMNNNPDYQYTFK